MPGAGNSAKFEITDAELHVPIVTLSTKDSATLTKQTTDLKDLFNGIVMKQNLQNRTRKKPLRTT